MKISKEAAMETSQVTDRIWMFRFPVGQAYAVRLPDDSWALVDTGLPGYAQQILTALRGLGAAPGDLREIVLTHSHGDHTGSAAALAAATGARVLAGADDAPVIRGDVPEPPPAFLDWEVPLFESVHELVPELAHTTVTCPVDGELADGDTLDWGEAATVVHVPGHTAGGIALHLPASGVLFTGDTIANVQQLMPGVFNTDRPQLFDSFRRQAALDVETACFGHGDPLVGGAGKALRAVAAALD
ncbi:MBL fold metallo-hydrolase [Streptomyces rectiverticillatus]|uniref:MBL fold metallo-hydrolase n=1 Tax=Streptomyces rectiverticillatus TaxID=173860 RepID=UPI001FE6CD95|nr:MBL fold metallo-hydrolase [Streptomyces rectiverticillatus]